MNYCTSCGNSIPDGQGNSCSMCYGDISHGTDGYYEEWARQREEHEREEYERRREEEKKSLKEKSIQEKNMKEEIFEKLIDKYAMQVDLVRQRTFGLNEINTPEWRFRRLITNVIVGGSSEDNALAASAEIFSVWKDATELAWAQRSSLIGSLLKYDIKWAPRRADCLIEIATHVMCNGVPSTREELESLPGVGRHVAGVVLALAFGKNEFGVDLHVVRIVKRLGLVNKKATEKTIEKYFSKVDCNLGTLSRAFVEHGHAVCSYKANCTECFLSSDCPSSTINKKYGTYRVPSSIDGEYIVTINDGVARCTCKGFKFRHTCKHIKMVERKESV